MIAMPYSLSRVKIDDYVKFKSGFDEASALRRAYGAKGAKLFRDVDDPDDITLLVEWDNFEDARKFLQAEEVREALKRAGVIKAEFYLLNAI